MIEHGISGLPVVDMVGQLLGSMTEFDLLDLVWDPTNERTWSTPARPEMLARYTLTVTWELWAELFRTLSIRRLIVMDEEKVVGIVSRPDLLCIESPIRSTCIRRRTVMKDEHIDLFFQSVVSVFGTMLGCELKRNEPYLKDGLQATCEVSGVIGLSGKLGGTVVLSLEREVALSATEALLMLRPDDINADVTDAIGELTNMIAGSAKAKLEEFELSVGLPNVVTGSGHCINFHTESPPVCMSFECDWGTVVVEVGLVDNEPQDAKAMDAETRQAVEPG